jgi:hypothetical protein
MILSVLMKQRINENTVWTDSQDYGADEILYTGGTALFNKISRLIREITILFGVSPQLLPSCSKYVTATVSTGRYGMLLGTSLFEL